MFRLETYIKELLSALKDSFGDRLIYIGLQGSYLRNEQNENSDIDIMAVIDELTTNDLICYRSILKKVGYFEKSCGFICGKAELAAWNPLEICHLLYTTKDLYGTLAELVPVYSKNDQRNFIKLSICNLYHELCHRYIHSDKENNIAKLPLTYKAVFFILQNLYYYENNVFYNSKSDLINHLEGKSREVMLAASNIQKNSEYDFDYSFNLLFSWCQEILNRL